MASITSVISLLVVLAVSCYSLPVEQSFATSTFGNELTTGNTILVNESAINMHLISEDESTSVPIIQKIQKFFEHGINEVTTSVVEQLHENVTFVPRSVDEVPESAAIDAQSVRGLNEIITIAPRSVDEVSESATIVTPLVTKSLEIITIAPRSVAGDLFPAVESSKEFEQRAIRPDNVELVKESAVVVLNGTDVESSATIKPLEVTSSFTNFAQSTGLIPSHDFEVVSTTEELLTTELPVESGRFVKTVAIIPGQITQTKIYPNVPSKTVGVAGHVQPLSQGQKQSIVEKEESNY